MLRAMNWTPLPISALAVLLACSCASMDPEMQRATDYVTRLQPLLQENSLLAERVLLQAAVVYNDQVEPKAMVDAWTQDVVPIAEHLHNQSVLVAAPQGYGEAHQQLVIVWGERARAYRDLSEAIYTADTKQWTKAKEDAKNVRIREEEWFEDLNSTLAARGIVVDPYP